MNKIKEFYNKHNIDDDFISSYTHNTINDICLIMKDDSQINSMIKNNDILNFIGLYHYYEKKDKGLGINSLLYAINIGCIESIYHLGLIYYNDNKLKDAEKYFLMSSKKHDFSLFYLYEIYKHSS